MDKKALAVPFVRTPFNYDRNAASDESGLACLDESRTKQSFAEEVDINTIMRRFGQTGQLPENVRPPTYQDFVGIFDFHTAMNAVASAGESFDKMPADVRTRFHNDPAEFVAFCSDDSNLEAMDKMGLTSPEFKDKLAAQRRAAQAEMDDAERKRIAGSRESVAGAGVDGLRSGDSSIDEQGAQRNDRGAARSGGERDPRSK